MGTHPVLMIKIIKSYKIANLYVKLKSMPYKRLGQWNIMFNLRHVSRFLWRF